MNARTIKAYIANLEKENRELREMLRDDDEESITSTETIVNVNDDLANMFHIRAQSEKNVHKSIAFKNAGDIIKNLPFEVKNGEELLHMRGIGKGIATLINDYLNN